MTDVTGVTLVLAMPTVPTVICMVTAPCPPGGLRGAPVPGMIRAIRMIRTARRLRMARVFVPPDPAVLHPVPFLVRRRLFIYTTQGYG
ncbi:hypothetical protein ACFZBU_33700 [Embleya sp. NPDC008237]|uniref:hypothetical protein n=1 Tax=Embleya sp. NPDC008237 TaxID=3363978 RepID=UPI0036EBA910